MKLDELESDAFQIRGREKPKAAKVPATFVAGARAGRPAAYAEEGEVNERGAKRKTTSETPQPNKAKALPANFCFDLLNGPPGQGGGGAGGAGSSEGC